MKKFEYLPHTADVLFDAHGTNFTEAIENAALALFDVTAKVDELAEAKKIRIEVKAKNEVELVNFALSALVSESDAKEMFFKRFKIISIEKAGSGFSLEGNAYGEPMTPAKGKTYVKAVTLHEAGVRKGAKSVTLHVLLDI